MDPTCPHHLIAEDGGPGTAASETPATRRRIATTPG